MSPSSLCQKGVEDNSFFLYILLHPLSRTMSKHTLYPPVLQDESLQVIMWTTVGFFNLHRGWLSLHRGPPVDVPIRRTAHLFSAITPSKVIVSVKQCLCYIFMTKIWYLYCHETTLKKKLWFYNLMLSKFWVTFRMVVWYYCLILNETQRSVAAALKRLACLRRLVKFYNSIKFWFVFINYYNGV